MKCFSVHETQLRDKHLVELNALAFTNTVKKNKNKVSTKEQKRKNEFLEAH